MDWLPVLQLSCVWYIVTYLYFRVHLRVSSPRRAVRVKLLNQEISCSNGICPVMLTVIEMFLGVGSFPQADVSFSTLPFPRVFFWTFLFTWNALECGQMDQLSPLGQSQAETGNLLCILRGINKQGRWFSKESDPCWRSEVMLQYCGVLLLQIFLLSSQAMFAQV